MAIRPGWISTYSGITFYPDDPDPELICIEDIAHALAMQCRWCGHTSRFYSVAQHSCLVSDHVTIENSLWGLFHDGAEAYLHDISSPLKKMLSGYKAMENGVLAAIAQKFGLPEGPPEEVLDVDQLVRATEADNLMKSTDAMKECFNHGQRIPGLEIYPWIWEKAEAEFLMRATQLFTKREMTIGNRGTQ